MKKVDILVNPKKRFYCEDYGEKKGCGEEVKLIKTPKGKTVACTPVQIPCYDREGNVVWAFVPHWATCSEAREYFLDFMSQKAEENAKWFEENVKGGGESEGRSRRRGGARRAEY